MSHSAPGKVARTLLMVGCLGLALLAQAMLDGGSRLPALALALLATVGFAWAAAPFEDASQAAPLAPARPLAWSGRRWLLLGAGLALALASYRLLGPNRFTAPGTAALLLGVALCLVALWDTPAPGAGLLRWLGAARRGEVPLQIEWLALLAITGVAAFYRLHLIDAIPGEAGPDIPLKLQIVRGMLAGERPIWSTVYPGREVLFFYVAAVYGWFFGANHFALKFVAALFSIAAVPMIYALAARWFGRGVGLAAAALLALAPWAITIGRIGFRGGALMAPMIVLTLALLDRALEREAWRDLALLGFVAGLGVYTYTAYEVVPPALVLVWLAVVAAALIRRWHPREQGSWLASLHLRWLAAALLLALLLVPLLRFVVSDFEHFFQRAGSRVTNQEVPLPQNLAATLLGNAANSLGMFNLRGDVVAVQNVPERRMLGLASGALFLLGLGVALSQIRRRRYRLIIFFLLVMQLPSALAIAFPQEVPGAVRAAGAIVPAYLLAALPLPLLWRAARRSLRGVLLVGSPERPWRLPVPALGAGALGVGIALLLAGEARESYTRYYVDYVQAQPYANYPLTREIARVIDDYAGEGPAFMPVYAYWTDGNAIRAQMERMPQELYREVPQEQFNAELFGQVEARALFLLRPDDTQNIATLRAAFPRGALVGHRDFAGNLAFYSFYAER